MVTVVTGGAGFIGRHLVEALVAEDTQVRVFDIKRPDPAFPPTVDYVQGSITSPAQVAGAVEGADTVFHLAANAQLWAADPNEFDEINHKGTLILLEQARKAQVPRVIHVSSLTVLIGRSMRGQVRVLNENTDVPESDMLGPYPLSKWRAEKAALAANTHDFEVTAALPTIPVGPGDIGMTAPTSMILDLLNGEMPAYLECHQNIIHVRDVARGLILARDKGRSGARYILGGDNLTMSETIGALEGLTGLRMPKIRVPYALALAAGIVQDWISTHVSHKPPQAPLTGVRLAGRPVQFDISRARTELGLEPVSSVTALQDAARWLKDQGLTRRAF